MPVIKGTAYWSKHIKADRKFKKNGGGVWAIDVCKLDKDTRDELKEIGLGKAIKNDDDEREFYITLKRNEIKSNGEQNTPPEAVDSQNNVFKGAIGNGSEVKVRFRTYSYDGGVNAEGQTYPGGTSSELVKIQVIDLVPYETDNTYESDDEPFEAVKGGFVVSADNDDDSDVPFETDDEVVAG